jgi:16S rRNA (uracil1498-N3)-methyltransferase
VFVEADLAPGAVVSATPAQAHYLVRVMRRKTGAAVRLFNGRDGEFAARVEQDGRTGCRLAVDRQVRPQRAEPGPTLLFSPLKKDAVDFLAVKATELGVARLAPVFTRFTTSGRVNRARLAANATEAAEQCGRLTVPAVDPPCPLQRRLAAWPDRIRLWVCDPGSGQAAGEAFAGAAGSAPAPCLLIGPEGGFAADELDALKALHFVSTVSLGPRILRAETAAVAALACWQALAGDWAAAPRGDTER